MKITIDTTADSKEEIRKAIKLLISLVGAGEIYINEQSQSEKTGIAATPEVTNAMAMFDSIQKAEEKQGEEKPVEKTAKDIPEIELY